MDKKHHEYLLDKYLHQRTDRAEENILLDQFIRLYLDLMKYKYDVEIARINERL
jgi:hypothetical protein